MSGATKDNQESEQASRVRSGMCLQLRAQQSAWEISGDSRIWLRSTVEESFFSCI